MRNIIFIHGLESSGKGFKGQFFQRIFPGCITPSFKEYSQEISYKALLNIRMEELKSILNEKANWIIIGSSFGGLMATLYAIEFSDKVIQLILLAPLLAAPELDLSKVSMPKIPVIIYHGKQDNIVSLKTTKKRAEKIFPNLTFKEVEDDHMLHSTIKTINWKNLLI